MHWTWLLSRPMTNNVVSFTDWLWWHYNVLH